MHIAIPHWLKCGQAWQARACPHHARSLSDSFVYMGMVLAWPWFALEASIFQELIWPWVSNSLTTIWFNMGSFRGGAPHELQEGDVGWSPPLHKKVFIYIYIYIYMYNQLASAFPPPCRLLSIGDRRSCYLFWWRGGDLREAYHTNTGTNKHINATSHKQSNTKEQAQRHPNGAPEAPEGSPR